MKIVTIEQKTIFLKEKKKTSGYYENENCEYIYSKEKSN